MIGTIPGSRRSEPVGRVVVGALALAMAAALCVAVTMQALRPEVVLLAAGGAVLLALSAWRPTVGCVLLALAGPLTTGLGRGALVPGLRPSEAVTLLVAAGVLAHHLPRRQRRPFLGLDLAMVAFTMTGTVVPWLVLFVTRAPADFTTWQAVLAPTQYLLLYVLFSRVRWHARMLQILVHMVLLASVIVAVIAIAQLLDVPGVRDFLELYFPGRGEAANLCLGRVCRPTSLLEHWSSVGAFGVLNYALALALVMVRHPAWSGPWLPMVIALNAVAVLASQTQAAILGLVLVTVAILVYARRVPRQLGLAVLGIAVGLLLLWPQLSARVDQQFGGADQGGPESVQVRVGYWSTYFIPTLVHHGGLWLGTGTVVPTDVPAALVTYVDNEYLRAAFRAGLPAVVVLLGLLAVIVVAGWRARASPDPWHRAVGAAALASALALGVMGTTAEYFTFAGVAQQFWMTVGLLAAFSLRSVVGRAAVVVRPAQAARASRARALRRLLPEAALLRSSGILFLGSASARLLGFLFSVAAARLLLPAGYGLLAYALAIANIAAVLITNAPTGLSRFIVRSRGDRAAQDAHFSNWLVIIGGMLALSLVLAVPLALLAGLSGWMLVGVMANLVGLAVFFSYRETQRGLEHYVAMVVYAVAANGIQLVAILLAAAAGARAPALFLIIYGLSSLAPLWLMLRIVPLRLRFVREAIHWHRLLAVARFIRPAVVQTVFFAVWFGADLILVQRLLNAQAAGNYAAAKTLAYTAFLAPGAIATGLVPRIARLPLTTLRPYLLRVLGLAAAVTVPVFAGLALFGKPATVLIFGVKYPQVTQPLTILALGMALYGLYLVLESTWFGLGRPVIDALATGSGMLATPALALLWIPAAGLTGAAWAFTAGAAVQLGVIGGFTVWSLYLGRGARAAHLEGDGGDARVAP
jgi:O-antigen/teichoic acid export membrane protein